jgi:hypothetical protein
MIIHEVGRGMAAGIPAHRPCGKVDEGTEVSVAAIASHARNKGGML